MKIHTNTLTEQDIHRAAFIAGGSVAAEVCEPRASRKRHHAFEVRLTGSSKYACQGLPGCKAATWDEWGIFLDTLFKKDSTMIANQYNGYDDFLVKTRAEVERFAQYRPDLLKKASGPWLKPLAGESQDAFERAVGRATKVAV